MPNYTRFEKKYYDFVKIIIHFKIISKKKIFNLSLTTKDTYHIMKPVYSLFVQNIKY